MLLNVLDAFCCPLCRRRDGAEPALIDASVNLTCCRCGEQYPIENGIPVFLLPALRDTELSPEATEEDRQKWQQRKWHDQHELVEWNINDPHHAPLKEYCLYRQMGTAFDLISEAIRPTRVLNVCCGSGLEAEFFSRRCNLPIIGTDISIGMLRNAVERASRGRYGFVPVCADSENLPFRTHSVDLAVVLHGLHHLPHPTLGLLEMARVAGSAICLFEPATSPIRALMMQLKLISPIEDSGNISYDFSEDSGFGQVLSESGFDRIVYKRELWSSLVSELRIANVWPVRIVAERLFDTLHAGMGCRWGTKLTVVAWRSLAQASTAST